MRELTQKEIDNAPLEYDSYYEDGHGNIRLINTESFKTCSVKRLPNEAAAITFDKYHYSLKTCKPIPRKQEAFDIGNHELNDDNSDICRYDNEKVVIGTACHDLMEIHKKDAIALAKRFKLTAEDLK